MYFVLTNDILVDFIIEPKNPYPNKDFFAKETRFDTGIAIDLDKLKQPIEFLTKAGFNDSRTHFYSTFKGELVMSAQFLQLIEQAGVVNIQKVPAVVESTKDQTVWEDYFVVNIIGLVECVDFEKSVYTKSAWETYDFEHLAIFSDKAENNLLFRLKEYSDVIIIHKSVGKSLRINDPDELLKGWDVTVISQ